MLVGRFFGRMKEKLNVWNPVERSKALPRIIFIVKFQKKTRSIDKPFSLPAR